MDEYQPTNELHDSDEDTSVSSIFLSESSALFQHTLLWYWWEAPDKVDPPKGCYVLYRLKTNNNNNDFRILGVCGGIGSGKSTASKLLVSECRCWDHLDVDSIAHSVYSPGSQAIQDVVSEFGSKILIATTITIKTLPPAVDVVVVAWKLIERNMVQESLTIQTPWPNWSKLCGLMSRH
jgi:Dephospho-CoA kinase